MAAIVRHLALANWNRPDNLMKLLVDRSSESVFVVSDASRSVRCIIVNWALNLVSTIVNTATGKLNLNFE